MPVEALDIPAMASQRFLLSISHTIPDFDALVVRARSELQICCTEAHVADWFSVSSRYVQVRDQYSRALRYVVTVIVVHIVLPELD